MPTIASSRPLPKSKMEHWLFGNAYYLADDPLNFLSEMRMQYPIYKVSSQFKKIAVINDPELVKYVLVENNKNYHKSFGYEALKLVLGMGLLTSEGEFWKKQRRLIQPAFHRKKLAEMTVIMAEKAALMKERWVQFAEQGKTVDISSEMMSVALQVVSSALFSTDVQSAIEQVEESMNIANEAGINRIRNPFALPTWLPTPRNLKERKAVQKLDDVLMDIINKRRKDDKQYSDLLGMLMDAVDEETGEGMTNLQLRDEAMTLFLAGHETTANALTWAWHLLSQNRDKEQKLHEELDRVLRGRIPSFEDLSQLTYTRQVIDEALRLYPPAWLIGRNNIHDDVIGGCAVPAGTNLLMCPYSVHRDPRYWEQPNEFIPERFETGKLEGKPKFAYFPFGGGPRLCIGNNFALMEMQIIVATLGSSFQLRTMAGYTPEPDPLITLRPKHGIPMTIEGRS